MEFRAALDDTIFTENPTTMQRIALEQRWCPAVSLTEEIARAAGWDAGNRSMYQHGRKRWDVEDIEAATKEFCRLM